MSEKQIVKFNNSSYIDWGTFGGGTLIGSAVNSNHPVTGYAVTAASTNVQDSATYSSTWSDFMNVTLERTEATGQLRLLVNGSQVTQTTDTSFNQFSRIYVRGNTTSYFDEIVFSSVPEPSSIGFGMLGLLFLFRRKARR